MSSVFELGKSYGGFHLNLHAVTVNKGFFELDKVHFKSCCLVISCMSADLNRKFDAEKVFTVFFSVLCEAYALKLSSAVSKFSINRCLNFMYSLMSELNGKLFSTLHISKGYKKVWKTCKCCLSR